MPRKYIAAWLITELIVTAETMMRANWRGLLTGMRYGFKIRKRHLRRSNYVTKKPGSHKGNLGRFELQGFSVRADSANHRPLSKSASRVTSNSLELDAEELERGGVGRGDGLDLDGLDVGREIGGLHAGARGGDGEV